VVGISCDSSGEDLLKFLGQNRDAAWPQLFDAANPGWHKLAEKLGVNSVPTVFLIDRKGASCTAEQIAAALWEDEDNMKNLKARIRILISDLRQTLAKIGMEDLIIRRSGQIAIRRELIDCDYYRMLDGDMDAVNAFRGEYMVQYSWAELTAGLLAFGK
jgi:hypothetical protein